jgi:hypothetical protein
MGQIWRRYWIRLAVNQIKAETVKKCFAKAGFEENDGADLEEVSENTAAIYNLCNKRTFL